MMFSIWWNFCCWRQKRAKRALLRWEARRWNVEDMMRTIASANEDI